jgi:hypothetical protein
LLERWAVAIEDKCASIEVVQREKGTSDAPGPLRKTFLLAALRDETF